jgi:membrane-associated phospholipid phosphatase
VTAQTGEVESLAADSAGIQWKVVAQIMTRPQPVTLPMVALAAIIPLYLVIGAVVVPGRTLHVPEIALDRAMALSPAWSFVYLSLFLAALLPVFVIHQQELVRRTILAFIAIWLIAYACFIAYPTIGPRPASVAGDGFSEWTLRAIYSSDHRYNCLPSLHVAQCFLAAFACHRVDRRVGLAAMAWAFAVGLSTVYTKQHYVMDVVTGVLLAMLGYVVALRGYPPEATPERERRYAPVLAACAVGVYATLMLLLLAFYLMGVQP